MGLSMVARERFVQTRKAVIELNAIKAKLSESGDDWRPDGIPSSETPDPTANQATYNVDVLGDLLERLRNREGELEEFIGGTLELIEHVRRGLGDDYANILDWRYIDGLTWEQIGIASTTGKRKASIAFDWIDSLGMTKLLRGEYEI